MLTRFRRNHSPTQSYCGAILILSGLAILARPVTSIGTTAFIEARAGIPSPLFALTFLLCGAILLFIRQSPPRFFLLHIPVLFYISMACWYFLITPALGLFPLAVYVGYIGFIVIYTKRTI